MDTCMDTPSTPRTPLSAPARFQSFVAGAADQRPAPRQPAGKVLDHRDLAASWNQLHPDQLLTPQELRVILLDFYARVVEQLLTGYEFALGYELSSIRIQKKTRSFRRNPRIDWEATMRYRQQRRLEPDYAPETDEKVHLHYHEQPHWFRFYWKKTKCKVQNRHAYKFTPTRGPLGNSRKLARYLKANEFAEQQFDF